jgi:hypothetical protein
VAAAKHTTEGGKGLSLGCCLVALTPTGGAYSSSKKSTGSLSLCQRIGNRRRGDDNVSWRRLVRLSHGCNFRLSGNVLRQRFGLFEMLPAVADLIHERQDRYAPDRDRYDEARLAGDHQHVKLAPFEYGQKWFIRGSFRDQGLAQPMERH